MDRVIKIINEWDPANLLSHAPDDEYDFEINQIIEKLNSDISSNMLAETIKQIFTQSFGSDINYDMETYLKIANNILQNK